MLNDISLVPIDTLLKEIESRSKSFVAAFETYEDKKHISWFYFGKGDWRDAVHISDILHNDVLNNWNGELKTLQRINEEETEEED